MAVIFMHQALIFAWLLPLAAAQAPVFHVKNVNGSVLKGESVAENTVMVLECHFKIAAISLAQTTVSIVTFTAVNKLNPVEQFSCIPATRAVNTALLRSTIPRTSVNTNACNGSVFSVNLKVADKMPRFYSCEVNIKTPAAKLSSNVKTLGSFVAPKDMLVSSFPLRPKEGSIVQYTCTASGRPPPNLILKYNGIVQISTQKPPPSQITLDSPSGVTTLTWNTTALPSMNGKTVRCEVDRHLSMVNLYKEHSLSVEVVNDCSPTKCTNLGICTDLINDFSCSCRAGWTGKTCDQDINDCIPNKCLNGGICKDGFNNYTCICGQGWSGRNCEMYAHIPVLHIKHLNGSELKEESVAESTVMILECQFKTTASSLAHITVSIVTYTSANKLGSVEQFSCIPATRVVNTALLRSTIPRTSVNSNACNGSVFSVNLKVADKMPRFYSCEVNVKMPATKLSSNVRTLGSFVAPKDMLVSSFPLRPKEGSIVQYTCTASGRPPPNLILKYNGTVQATIQKTNGSQASLDSPSGVTTLTWNTTALPSMNGRTLRCEVVSHLSDAYLYKDHLLAVEVVNDCPPNKCTNSGTCTDLINDFFCSCRAGWTGKICELDINDCLPNKCLNEGFCKDGFNNYTCICGEGWSGRNCEKPTERCLMGTCSGHGKCYEVVGGKTICMCDPGYTSTHCEQDVNDCTPTSCLNGGTCLDKLNNFSCSCRPGWTGRVCEKMNCTSKDISVRIAADERTKAVEVSPGVQVHFSEGKHLYMIPDTNCTIHVTVNQGFPLKRRLDFQANYNIGCQSLTNDDVIMVLNSVVSDKFTFIEHLCDKKCTRSPVRKAEISCKNDITTVTWPTNTDFEEKITSVPDNILTAALSRLSSHRNELQVVVLAHAPPVINPNINSSGELVSLVLTPVCESGTMYDDRTDSCRRKV